MVRACRCPSGTRIVPVGDPALAATELEVVQTKDGTIRSWITLPGSWGVPVVVNSANRKEGLSADGKTLVLGDLSVSFPRTASEFLVVDPSTLRVRKTIELNGDFAYDALAPDGSRLYLIQHVDPSNSQRYVVRSYDLAAGRLVSRRIADPAQAGWVMQGYPVARTTSENGRWVYTLYGNPGGYPFVHALDTTRGVAHCIGLPWRGSQSGFYNLRLSLGRNGRTLAVHWLSGRPWFAVDTSTWRVTPDRPAGLPWLGVGAACAAALAALAAFAVRRRRRRAHALELELGKLLAHARREIELRSR